jgi:HEXXH motif-containing protein
MSNDKAFVPADWVSSRGLAPEFIQQLLVKRSLTNTATFLALSKHQQLKLLPEATQQSLAETQATVRALPRSGILQTFANPVAMRFVDDFSKALMQVSHASESDITLQRPNVDWDALIFDLNRVVVTCAALNGLETSLPCLAQNGYIHLPPVGISIPTRSDTVYLVTSTGKQGIAIDEQLYELGSASQEMLSARGCLIAPLLFEDQQTKVDAFDPTLNFHWITKQKFPYDIMARPVAANELDAWRLEAKEQFKCLEDVWPEMARNVIQMNNTLVPVYSKNRDVSISSTSDSFWGAILVSQAQTELFCESLVHEHSHNVMYAMLRAHKLLLNDGLTPISFYSPWRPDARPVYGIFHAVYVFDRVCEYYSRLLQRDPTRVSLATRLSLFSERIRVGVLVLEQCAQVSDEGINLLGELKNNLTTWNALAKNADRAEVQTRLSTHYKKWCEDNPRATRPIGLDPSWVS